ncbi:ABC transporter permease subunit [Klebsiella pneumoniae]
MTAPGIEVRGLSLHVGDRRLFDNLSFTVPGGQWVSLLGASGAGKTSLLRVMAGLAPATRGEVVASDGQPIQGRLAWMGQKDLLYPWLSVRDNVALAPLLVLWLGFGMSAKVAMAVLVIFFPVTSAFFDGLRRVNQEYLDLARSMNASFGAQLRHVRLMAALPALGSGLRMAAAVAPIGAIIGEWVGSAEGLGYVMLNANARLQTDICFAALFILVLLTLLLWLAVDTLLHRLIDWSPE